MQGNRLTQEFLDLRAHLDDRRYLMATMAYHAAPVCSGLKPSALINLGRADSRLAQLWARYRMDVDSFKGLSVRVFTGMGETLQLFCYNAGHLKHTITNGESRAYLESLGYNSSLNIDDSIAVLKQGFINGCPNEVGIFLGYPVTDVKAFIRYGGKNYLLNGYWKVYSDASCAVRMFQAFDQAKREMLREWKSEL